MRFMSMALFALTLLGCATEVAAGDIHEAIRRGDRAAVERLMLKSKLRRAVERDELVQRRVHQAHGDR